jgi:rubrerythrin
MNNLAVTPDEELTSGVCLADGIHLTPMGATIAPDITFDDYCEALARCQRLANATAWCVGDLILYGEEREWGEKYTQAISETGKSVNTLMAAVSVSRAYPPEARVEAVSWSHHREAMRLKDPEARHAALETAASEGTSALALREKLSDPKPKATTTCPQCGHAW